MGLKNKSVYKYYSANELNIKALLKSESYFSSIDQLNDPFEFEVSYSFPESREEKILQYRNYFEKIINERTGPDREIARDALKKILSMGDSHIIKLYENNVFRDHQSDHRKVLEKINVFSTSIQKNGAQDPSSNILMWAHYGQAFKGFCLQFKAEKYVDSVRALNPNSLFEHCEVSYVGEPHLISVVDCSLVDDIKYFESLQYKYRAWEYESEYRFLSVKHGLHSYSPECLEKIYLGEKIDEIYRSKILEAAKEKYPNVEVNTIRRKKDAYAIYSEPERKRI